MCIRDRTHCPCRTGTFAISHAATPSNACKIQANYAISETEGDNVVVFNGASLTATLPQSLNCAPGRRFTIKNIYAGNLTIATTSSQTIDGTCLLYTSPS